MEEAHLAGAKKEARREGRLIVFIDESGLSQRPTRVRTWAVKGQSPVVQFHFNWDHISIVAGLHLTVSPSGCMMARSKKRKSSSF